MSTQIGLEMLSAELFSEVVHCVPELRDRLAVSMVSRSLYHKIIPYIYARWDFYGPKHSFKSLYCFLRTIIEHPELASLVQAADFRDWERKADDGNVSTDSEESSLEEDGGLDEMAHEREALSQEKPNVTLGLAEMERQEAMEDQLYDHYIPLFRNAVESLPIEQYSIDVFDKLVKNRDPDILLALLLTKLPNLKALYMIVPKDQNGVIFTLGELGGKGAALRYLETIYICSALYTGVSQ